MSKKMGCDIAMNSGRMYGKLGAIPDVSRNVFESPKKKENAIFARCLNYLFCGGTHLKTARDIN